MKQKARLLRVLFVMQIISPREKTAWQISVQIPLIFKLYNFYSFPRLSIVLFPSSGNQLFYLKNGPRADEPPEAYDLTVDGSSGHLVV